MLSPRNAMPILLALVLALAGCAVDRPSPVNPSVPPATPSSPATSAPTASIPPRPKPTACPTPTTTVSTADELTAALDQASPGASIALARRVYAGRFVASRAANADRPIFVCGPTSAVIDAGGVRGGYGLHLDGADYWRIVGLTVRNAQKGVVVDHSQHTVLEGLTVRQIGDEAIHLRAFSSDNLVRGNQVSLTGLRRDKFGEGIYVGSAVSNWCRYSNCAPDNSDRNQVRDNVISQTTAEAVDVKEGTTAGVVADNHFDGSALTGADSWVDIKGDDWQITGNEGTNSPTDGYQTHEIKPGWGDRNTFAGNTGVGIKTGFGFHLAPPLSNLLSCDNQAPGAGSGLANIACS